MTCPTAQRTRAARMPVVPAFRRKAQRPILAVAGVHPVWQAVVSYYDRQYGNDEVTGYGVHGAGRQRQPCKRPRSVYSTRSFVRKGTLTNLAQAPGCFSNSQGLGIIMETAHKLTRDARPQELDQRPHAKAGGAFGLIGAGLLGRLHRRNIEVRPRVGRKLF